MFINFIFFDKSSKGQSLVEIIVALGLVSLFIISAVGAIGIALRNGFDVRIAQFTNFLRQDYSEKIQAMAKSDWHKLYDLNKGSNYAYFLAISGTQLVAVEGEESNLENDIVNGLVLYWKFDESTGTSVYNFAVNNPSVGILMGNQMRLASSSCRIGSCLSFNGINNFVSSSISGVLNFPFGNMPRTIAFWLYTVPNSWADNTHTIFDYGDNSNKAAFGIDMSSFPFMEFYTWGADLIINTGLSNPEGWFHVAMVYDGNGLLKAYINGRLISSTTTGVLNTATNSVFNLGRSIFLNSYFLGRIDDFRIYNRSLQDSEIKQLVESRIFTRNFFVENVNRDSCGFGNITFNPTTSCNSMQSGANNIAQDAFTQRVNISVNWSGGKKNNYVQYITRSRVKIFSQTNWSRGGNEDGPFVESSDQFSTSSNIDYFSEPGFIKLQNF
jgi:hypothetical protein